MAFNIIALGWEPKPKLNFCFPPDLWLLGNEVSQAGLQLEGPNLLGNILETWILLGGRGSLETGVRHRSWVSPY